MKKFYTLLATVLIITVTDGQVAFQKTYGGSGDDALFELKKTPAGYAMAGFTNSFGVGSYDFYLVKTDEIGNIQWSKTFGSTGSDECYGMIQALDGGYLMAGYTTSFGSLGTDVFIVKTDINGGLDWSRMISGFQDDFTITLTGDSGYLFIGTTKSFGSGQSDLFLCKVDIAGNLEWSKAIGGADFEWGFHINQTNDGGYIATGITFGFGAGNYDFYVVKIDADGNLQWTKTYGGTNRDDGRYAEQTFDSGYIITGYTQSFGTGGVDILLIKTDAGGNIQWSKTYGGTGNDYAESVKQTIDGKFIISGHTNSFGFGNSESYLLKTDSAGNIEWSRTFGGTNNEYTTKLITTSDGGYALSSRTQSFGAGNSDFYFIKTDVNGITGCNEILTTSTIANSYSIPVSSGGIAVNATPSVTAPSPTETNPTTVTTILCQNIPAGLFCANAIQLNPCIYNDTIIGSEKWYYFIPDSPNVEIILTNLSPNQNHVHDIILSAGICNIQQYPIASSSLSVLDSSISIKAWDLIVGVPHYIQLSRSQPDSLCLTNFANYDLCIQNISSTTIAIDTNGIVFIDGRPSHLKNEVTIRFGKSHLKMNNVNDTSKKEMPIPVFIQPQMVQKMAVQIYNGDVIGLGQLKLKKIFPLLTTNDSYSISRLGDTIPIPDFWSTFILTIPDTMSVLKTSRALNMINGIQYAEPNYVPVTSDVPNDEWYTTYQYSLWPSVQYPNADINVESAWDIEKGQSFIKIGVYDSGIDQTHDELKNGKVSGGYNFDANTPLSAPYDDGGHGTSCAGIIAAYRNNTTGIAGIAGGDASVGNPGCSLYDMHIKLTLAYNPSPTEIKILYSKAANAIVLGATGTNAGGYGLHIMSNSWGLPDNYNNGAYLLHDAIQFAVQNGVVFVASRGNYPQVTPIDRVTYPSSFQDEMIINVGASGIDGNWKTDGNGDPNDLDDNSYSSMIGHGVDFIAPGTKALVYTAKTNSNDYRKFNGTSAACPHVSGVAGLMLSHVNQSYPNPSNLCIEDIENILQLSAVDKNATGYDNYAGWGLIDATSAMNKIKAPVFKIQHFGVGSNTTSYTITPLVLAKDVKVILPNGYGNLSPGTYFADRVQVTITLNYNLNSPNDQILSYWPRFSSTVGWSGANPIVTDNWCYILSVSNTQAVLRTFIYNFKYAATGATIVDPWYPTDQFNVKAALSIYTFNPTLVDVTDPLLNNNILSEPFPNPGMNNTSIDVALNYPQRISINLFDIQGRLIKNIFAGEQAAGNNKYKISLLEIPSGIYFVQLSSEKEVLQKKLAVIK